MSVFKRIFKSKQQYKIYLLDDSKVFAKGMEVMLKNNLTDEYQISIFFDTNFMLKEIRNNSADLLIMDYNLDEDSSIAGVDLITKIKKEFPDIYIIVLTGRNEHDLAKRCFDQGANNYIVKNSLNIKETAEELANKITLLLY